MSRRSLRECRQVRIEKYLQFFDGLPRLKWIRFLEVAMLARIEFGTHTREKRTLSSYLAVYRRMGKCRRKITSPKGSLHVYYWMFL